MKNSFVLFNALKIANSYCNSILQIHGFLSLSKLYIYTSTGVEKYRFLREEDAWMTFIASFAIR